MLIQSNSMRSVVFVGKQQQYQKKSTKIENVWKWVCPIEFLCNINTDFNCFGSLFNFCGMKCNKFIIDYDWIIHYHFFRFFHTSSRWLATTWMWIADCVRMVDVAIRSRLFSKIGNVDYIHIEFAHCKLNKVIKL